MLGLDIREREIRDRSRQVLEVEVAIDDAELCSRALGRRGGSHLVELHGPEGFGVDIDVARCATWESARGLVVDAKPFHRAAVELDRALVVDVACLDGFAKHRDRIRWK